MRILNADLNKPRSDGALTREEVGFLKYIRTVCILFCVGFAREESRIVDYTPYVCFLRTDRLLWLGRLPVEFC